MSPELVLMRVPHQSTPSHPTLGSLCHSPFHYDSRTSFTGVAQWDQNHAFHLGVIAVGGILKTYTLETQEGGASYKLSPACAYQLHLLYGGDSDSSPMKELTVRGYNPIKLKTKAVDVELGSFEFIPGRPDDILFFQLNSSRILFARLPSSCGLSGENDTAESNKVFCIGGHSASIVCISVRTDGLVMLSMASDGSIRLWRLSDGSFLCEKIVSNASPAIYNLIRPIDEGGFGNKCDVCGEAQNSWFCARVLLFIGQSWEWAMGCMDGLVQLWTTTFKIIHPDSAVKDLELTATEIVVCTRKASILALAIHSPDLEATMQGAGTLPQTRQQAYEGEKQGFHSSGNNISESSGWVENDSTTVCFKEYMAAGTSEGDLMVWGRYARSQGWLPAWSTTSADVSIACLSFRADGGLLAAGANAAIHGDTRRLVDQVHLYETSSWSCVGTLNFSSRLCSCIFYQTGLVPEGRKAYKKGVESEWKLASGLLLICTSEGPETHLVPEFEVSVDEEQFKRRMSKTVSWGDTGEETCGFDRSFEPSVPPQFENRQGHPDSITDMIESVDFVDGDMHQVARANAMNSNSSIEMPMLHEEQILAKQGGNSRRSLEKCNTPKEVKTPVWNSSVAKIQIGYRMDLLPKDKMDHCMRRIKGGGHDISGSRKMECRVDVSNGQTHQQIKSCKNKRIELISRTTGQNEMDSMCQICSHPISHHRDSASGADQTCYYQLNNRTQDTENIQGNNQQLQMCSGDIYVQRNPYLCQASNEEKEAKVQTNRGCNKDEYPPNSSSSFENIQRGEDTYNNHGLNKKSDQDVKVLSDLELKDQKRSFMSSMLARKDVKICQTCLLPVRDQTQEAWTRGTTTDIHPHTRSTAAEQGISAGSVDVVKNYPQETCIHQAPEQFQSLQTGNDTMRMSSLHTSVQGDLEEEQQNYLVKMTQPLFPCELNGGIQNFKPCTNKPTTDPAHMPSTYSTKENHNFRGEQKCLRHSKNSLRNPSVYSTPTEGNSQLDINWRRESHESTPGRADLYNEEINCSWHGRSVDFEKACQPIFTMAQLKLEKDYRRSSKPSESLSHRSCAECQASLQAKHAKPGEISSCYIKDHEEIFPDCHHPFVVHQEAFLRKNSKNHVSRPQSPHNGGNHMEERYQKRPMSASIIDQLQDITASRDFREEFVQSYRNGKFVSLSKVKDNCAGCRKRIEQSQETFSISSREIHPVPRTLRLKPKLEEHKKAPFCSAGLDRFKRPVMPEPPAKPLAKKSCAVLPVITLYRDKQKGVWSSKANQKDWDARHQGCCSQHWVSILDTSKKYAEGYRGHDHVVCSTRLSPNLQLTPKVMSTARIMQKLQAVRAEKFRPKAALSLIRGSQFDNNSCGSEGGNESKTGSSRHMDSLTRKSSSCRGFRNSIAIPPAQRLRSPEVNSTAWLLAKLEELQKESFTPPKAVQIAKEYGLLLDREDEADLKKYLRDKKCGVEFLLLDGEREARHTHKIMREHYGSRQRIKLQHQRSLSELWAASDQCSRGSYRGRI